MPNKHAAIKALRKSKKSAAKNARMKMHAKALMHQFQQLMKEGKKAEAATLAPKLQQTFAKAGKAHVFHANKAGRKISSIHRALAKTK